MKKRTRFALLLATGFVMAAADAQTLAPTPPMGWNSWDSYGFTITEDQYKANATALASLKDDGWVYAVIDMGWYMDNPLGDKTATRGYQLDAQGRLIPDTKRFPSATDGAGFKPLADWAHAQGLKFGIHIMRGIPREAVAKNMPIADSPFHAADAADTSDTCPWDDGNYGVRNNAAGQAYYDSIAKLYAGWGVDFIKIDCISDHPYKPDEIREVASAIAKTGKPIVLSLSPGPTQLVHGPDVMQSAQMWRIADDIWDKWSFKPEAWPNGLETAFDNLAKWHPYAGPGHWPDADMLPFGSLTPAPGWGKPRPSGLTPIEERTEFTLWSIARSPLILGGNLTLLDDFTRTLITNKDVIAVNQTAWESEPVTGLPPAYENVRVWRALTGPRDKPVFTVAIFNLDDKPVTLSPHWKDLGVPAPHRGVRELWSGKMSKTIRVTLPAHGSALYRIE